jgi:hypothetical protein
MRAAKPDADYSAFTAAEDVADTLVYLCSAAAQAMNGRRLMLC